MLPISALAPSDTAKKRLQRLQFGVVALGALVILVFAGSSAYDAWRSYRYAVKGTERELNKIKLETSDALFRAGDFAIHVAISIFPADDISEQFVV